MIERDYHGRFVKGHTTNIGRKQRQETINKRAVNHSKTMRKLFAEGKIIPWNLGKKLIESPKKGKSFEYLYGKERTEQIKLKIIQARAKQIIPKQDTSIEIKIQNFLRELGINFFTHVYMKDIQYQYRCDIFIPSTNTIIECDGDYFHANPIKYNIQELNKRQEEQKQRDEIRTKELQQNGYRVLRLWESEIKDMNLNKFKEKIQ